MSAVYVREFRFPEDYEQVHRLWEEAAPGVRLGPSDTREEIRKKLERDPDLFLVAEADGQIVGTVMGGFDGRRGLLYHLAVRASHRRQGVGERLMQEVENRLRAKGCRRCYLMVTADNTTAMRFYEKRGWSRMDAIYTYAKNL